jgi:hypothetical protein
MQNEGADLVATVRRLLKGHTSRGDERLILRALAAASGEELDRALCQLDLAALFGDTDDRWFGPDHRTELLALLCSERLGDLGVPARAAVIGALQRGRTCSADERAVRDVFVATTGPDLVDLKDAIERAGGYRDLHQLVYRDVDDAGVRAEILAHFAAEAAKQATPRLKVLSDIDDTFYCNWKDERYPKKTVYPGVLAFYRALGGGLVFVSARPGDRAGLVETQTLATLRERGVTAATVLCGAFSHLVGNDRIAAKKYANFVEFRALYPDHRFVFVGDSGQGDVAFGEMMLDDPAAVAVFIHDVVATPAGRRRELAAKRIHLFDTYAGAAAAAHGCGLLDAAALREIARAVGDELSLATFLSDVQRDARRADLERDLALLAAWLSDEAG